MLRNGRSLRSYNDLAGRNGSGLCGDATMPRGIPGGLIETMDGGVRTHSCAAQPPSDRKTPCLENPRPKAEYSLTENVASPFQAEPRQSGFLSLPDRLRRLAFPDPLPSPVARSHGFRRAS